MKKRLVICPQAKGGIGKSTFTMNAVEWARGRTQDLKIFDLDNEGSALTRFIPDAIALDSRDRANLDELVKALETASCVYADNRGFNKDNLVEWLKDTNLTAPEIEAETGIRVTFVILAFDDKDALSQAADVVGIFGNNVDWLLVRNEFHGGSMPIYDNANFRKRILDQLNGVEIRLKKIDERLNSSLQRYNITPSVGAKTGSPLWILDRQRCRNFERDFFNELNKAERLLLT